MSGTDRLSQVFAALADPTRRAMLERLGQGSATVTELAEPFAISLPAVSRHLKVLESAGLVARDRRAQWRPSSLRGEALYDARRWMDGLLGPWDHRLDRLAAHLETRQAAASAAGGKDQP
ncbi:MAG: metalloregulator ArsR/SmtB family transcription factor [Nocardioides sp.]